MKRCFSGISIVVLLMIVMSSIIQFHHHDDKGNIIFAVTAICCNYTDEHHNNQETTGCNHCHHHEDHKCGDGEDCSAHLGDYQATKQTVLSLDTYPTLLLNAIACETAFYTNNLNSQKESQHIQSDPPINEGVRWTIGLRAPPCC